MPYAHSYPAPEKMTSDKLDQVFNRLDHLLQNLPVELPLPLSIEESRYHLFSNFSLDADILEKTGDEIATLGEQLEHIFGWKSRTSGDGIIPILERGRPICALQPLLKSFAEKYPTNNVIKKWVIDVAIGVEKVYKDHGKEIPTDTEVHKARKRALSESIEELGSIKKSKPEISVYQPSSSRGRPKIDLLDRIVTKYIAEDSGKKSWRCAASGCEFKRAGNADYNRALKHASTCKVLSQKLPDLFREVLETCAKLSLGAQLTAPEEAKSEPVASSNSVLSTRGPKSIQSNKLDVGQLRAAGQKRKGEEAKVFQTKVDHIIMRLICVRGLVPNLLDSPEWHELMGLMNPTYKVSSSSTFMNNFIPKEAVLVRAQQIELLRKEQNLTLTFDGNTIRKPQSLYTAHATTPSRQSYFLDGHEGSDERHNMEWIRGKLTKTLKSVGLSHWGAVCSDSTNVTKATRRELAIATTTIVDLCDSVHHIHNTIKDITKLEEFKSFIGCLKSIVKHFSTSSYSTANLDKELAANISEKVKALQKVGKTRFGTHWLASTALDPCLSTIRKMSTQVQGMLANRVSIKFTEFETAMVQYNSIIAPFIRSLWSLEAALANASDVFVFWLAIAATLNAIFKQDPSETGIPRSLSNKVVQAYNKRYTEFFQNDIYFTAFTLDPRYPLKDFLKLPPAPATITIPARDPKTGYLHLPMPYPQAYNKMKEYLKTMVINIYKQLADNPEAAQQYDLFVTLGESGAALELKRQLEAYWRGDWPFARPEETVEDAINDPREWWEPLQMHPQARVLAFLAIKIFSILVNSMPDERTNSTFTWLNSPLRGNQKAQTLVDMIQINQWYGIHQNPDGKKSRSRPVVKFRQIDPETLERLQTGRATSDQPEEQEQKEGDNESEDEDDDLPEVSQVLGQVMDTMEVAFQVDSAINISSPALMDLISEKPLINKATPAKTPEKSSAEEVEVKDPWGF